MDLKETIDNNSLDLPITVESLKEKLYAAEESHRRLREQNLSLETRLKEKDRVIDVVRSEASLNAQALKRFFGENRKISIDCDDLARKCARKCENWERECLLYDKDREALMEFGNESDTRANEAEAKVKDLDGKMRTFSDEINQRSDFSVDSVLSSLFLGEEDGHIFLETNVNVGFCMDLLSEWDQLKPFTRKVLSLVSIVKRIEKEKECLILNLAKAEEEVELVSMQNRELDSENRKLLKQCSSNSSPLCYAERNKPNRRKSPKRTRSITS